VSDKHEFETYNEGELLVAVANGSEPLDYAYEDEDLDELEEDEAYEPDAAPAPTYVSDAEQTQMEARLEQLEGREREREAARIHPKVIAGSGAAGVAATVAAVLPMIDGLNLTDETEALISVAVVLIATFIGGYLKSGRPPLEV
jgi:hypothetical protein